MEQAAPVSRRQRKKDRTRQDLIDAATRLFASQGFDGTTTDDIAEAADVSQRTFFRHFPSKEAVLYGDMDDLLERFRDNLELRPANEPLLASVRESILALAEDYEDQRKLRLLQARLAASSPAVSAYSRAVVQQAWERELGEALARRLGVDPVEDPRPEIIAAAAMSALRHSIRRWARSRGREELPAFVAQAFDAVFELAATSGTLV
jgi:TetR/AcrR family transcriptional regulator, regulator of mycofactocin system